MKWRNRNMMVNDILECIGDTDLLNIIDKDVSKNVCDVYFGTKRKMREGLLEAIGRRRVDELLSKEDVLFIFIGGENE